MGDKKTRGSRDSQRIGAGGLSQRPGTECTRVPTINFGMLTAGISMQRQPGTGRQLTMKVVSKLAHKIALTKNPFLQ